jgi:hypothetical protein
MTATPWEQVYLHLCAANAQRQPSDDDVIMDHIHDAMLIAYGEWSRECDERTGKAAADAVSRDLNNWLEGR